MLPIRVSFDLRIKSLGVLLRTCTTATASESRTASTACPASPARTILNSSRGLQTSTKSGHASSGNRDGHDVSDTTRPSLWSTGVRFGASSVSHVPPHTDHGLYPGRERWADSHSKEDWAFGGGSKSKSGRKLEQSVAKPSLASQQVSTVDKMALWDHDGHVDSPASASSSTSHSLPGRQDDPLAAHTYSGPSGGTVSPFDPTPGVPRPIRWGSPAPMESESELLGQRRAEKQRKAEESTGDPT